MSKNFEVFQKTVDQKFDLVINQNKQLENRVSYLEHKLHKVSLLVYNLLV